MSMRALMLASAMVLSAGAAWAEKVSLTDIAGRTVEVEIPVRSMILGEGRQTYLIAALDRDDPFQRVVGWRDDLLTTDPDTYARYLEKFPKMAEIPTFGGFKDGTFDVEQAIALDPDIMLMNIESKAATEDAKYGEKLAAAGIPLVYVDFREKPFENTEPSMRLMGQLLGKEAEAEEFLAFRHAQTKIVTDRLAEAKPAAPKVFIERAAGYSEDCCMSFGDDNFGKFVEVAGGANIAKDIIPGTFGTVNPEQVIASNPDQFVGTGGNWEHIAPGEGWIPMGPGEDMTAARAKLTALMERPAYTGIPAVKDGQVHAIWHQFYNSPYEFVAIQRMAKWFHPELFADLDPEATFRELHEKFLPIAYEPGYWVSVSDN